MTEFNFEDDGVLNAIVVAYIEAIGEEKVDDDPIRAEYDSLTDYLQSERPDEYYEAIDEFWYGGGEVKGLGHFDAADSWNLGDGHERGVIFRHRESGRYFRKTGHYSSWDSSDWDGPFEEVVPAEVKVVRFSPLGKPHVIYEYPALEIKDAAEKNLV